CPICAREPPHRLLEVPWVHDVIPIEHRAGLVAGDAHGDPLRHASVHQIPHRGTPEVMPEAASDATGPAGRRPCLPEVPPRLPRAPPLAAVRKQGGNDAPEPAL